MWLHQGPSYTQRPHARRHFSRLSWARGHRHRRCPRPRARRRGAAPRARRIGRRQRARRGASGAGCAGDRQNVRSRSPATSPSAGVPDAIVRQTLERFGRIDILDQQRGAARCDAVRADLTAEEWRQALEVNLTAPFLLIQAVLPAMKAQHYGRIINISSTAGRHGQHARRRALHRVEDRTPRPDARRGEGARAVRHHRQRRLSRHDRHRADARERVARAARPARRRAIRCRASAPRSKSPT